MTLRRLALGAALALAGLAAAVGIGLLANTISGDSVGLSAEPLSAGDTLTPPAAERRRVEARRREQADRRRAQARRRRAAAEQPPAAQDQTPPTMPLPVDDNGGADFDDDSSGRGRSDGDSGSSGSGSDDDSSGSGSDGDDFDD